MNYADLRQLVSRLHLGPLLVKHGLVGQGVEVGTYEGEWAHGLLCGWPGLLHCVDPWENLPTEEYLDGCNRVDLAECGRKAQERLRDFSKRVMYHKERSEDAVGWFADNSLDFAYIDGNHDYKHALADLANWSAKVRPGGIIGMHDCYTRNDEFAKCGVWDVVSNRILHTGTIPHLTGCTSVWYIKE